MKSGPSKHRHNEKLYIDKDREPGLVALYNRRARTGPMLQRFPKMFTATSINFSPHHLTRDDGIDRKTPETSF